MPSVLKVKILPPGDLRLVGVAFLINDSCWWRTFLTLLSHFGFYGIVVPLRALALTLCQKKEIFNFAEYLPVGVVN